MIKITLALAVLLPLVPGQTPPPTLQPDHVLTLEIKPTDPTLEGHGHARQATFTVTPTGPVTTVFLWAEPPDRNDVKTVDFYLQLHDAKTGKLVKEDDDSGGGKVPFLEVEVRKTTAFKVTVACASTTPATASLHLRIGHETEESLRIARVTREGIKELRKHHPILASPTVRSRIRELTHQLLATPLQSPDVAVAAAVTAHAASEAQDPETAAELWTAEAKLRSQWTGWCHRNLQWARLNLASTLLSLGKLDGALEFQEKVFQVWTLTLDDRHRDLQAARLNLSNTLFTLGKLDRALDLQQKVLQVFTLTLDDHHPDLQKARLQVAATLFTLGRVDQALNLQEEALQVLTLTLDDHHPDLQNAQGNLAVMLFALGKLDRAVDLQQKALQILTLTLDDYHPDVQNARRSLAGTLRTLGKLDRALELEEKALQVLTLTLDDRHPDLQHARGSLATTLLTLGKVDRALELQEKVLQVFTLTLDDHHPHLQDARGSLSSTLRTLGTLDRALELQEKVLQVLTLTLDDHHLSLQGARGNLAVTLSTLGEVDRALELQEKVFQILTLTLDDHHPSLQGARHDLAHTLMVLGKLDRALELQEKVLQVMTFTLDDHHPSLHAARWSLAWTHAAMGKRSFPTIMDALRATRGRARALATKSVFVHAASSHSSVLQELRWASCSLSLAENREALARETLRTLIAVQPLGFGGRGVRALLGGSDPKMRSRIEVLDIGLAGIAAELTRITGGGETEKLKRAPLLQRRDRIREEMDGILRAMPQSEFLLSEVTEKELGAALHPHQVAVAFTRYRPLVKTDKPSRVEVGAERYAAWVVQPGGSVSFIELCHGETLDEALETYLDGIGDGGSPDGADIERLLVAPLRKALGRYKEVLCTLDGALHAVPFEALAYDGGIVGDRLRFLVYPALRDVCVPLPGELRATSLLVLGHPTFDEEPAAIVTGAGDYVSLGDEDHKRGFPPLPASEREVERIAALFKQRFGNDAPCRVLLQDQASRRHLLRSIGTPRFVHLATHGYYHPQPKLARQGALIDPSLNHYGMDHGAQVQRLSPWTLCGIALAGANLDPDDRSRIEGQLSGEEVAALDLEGCELAVVSACDTAKGHQGHFGDAIFSLQAALHAAGARSVVTSLWKVPDGPTQALMVAFYRNLWVEKLPKHEALRAAQRELREAKDDKGNPKHTTRDWAGWVLTGDPR